MNPLVERYSDLLGEGADPALARLVADLDAVCTPHPLPPQRDIAITRTLEEQMKMHGTLVIVPASGRAGSIPRAVRAPRRISWVALAVAAALPLLLLAALLVVRGRAPSTTPQPGAHTPLPQRHALVAPAPAPSTARTVAKPAHVVYVAIGDNNTVGEPPAIAASQTYPHVLARYVPRGARMLVLGSSSEGFDDILAVDLPKALAAHPTLVTIWTTSDFVAPQAYYRATLDKILSAFRQQHARVFIGNMLDENLLPSIGAYSGPGYNPEALALNATIAAVAAKDGATVVDIYANTKLLYPHPELQGNIETLNSRGAAVLAQIFYRVMHSHGAL